MEPALIRRWYGAGAPAWALPLAWGYGGIVRARRMAYERGLRSSGTAGVPVVVVGNLTVGGTGKTPLVLWLATQLRARGHRPGIVTRGYRAPNARGDAEPLAVTPESDWREAGDEAVLLAGRSGCPVRVGRDRLAAARALAAGGAGLVISDDGLQHLALRRDLEIVVIDGARGFGNGHLLPAGPLREPRERLARADHIVINGRPEHPSLRGLEREPRVLHMSLSGGRAVSLDATACATRELSGFRSGPVHAVAGIGNPTRFFASLRAAGLEVLEHAFPDHHAFRAGDLAFGDAQPVLMTEKDAVKCRGFADPRLWMVPVEPAFGAADAARLLASIETRLPARAA